MQERFRNGRPKPQRGANPDVFKRPLPPTEHCGRTVAFYGRLSPGKTVDTTAVEAAIRAITPRKGGRLPRRLLST